MDNGSPWGTQSAVPSAFALWLVGLGVTPVYGRPARSTDNAVVERSHGVLARWVEPERCGSFVHCQQQLAWAVDTQRARYRAVRGQSRCQAYPSLLTNPRRYEAAHEGQTWDLGRVGAYLAQFVFRRKVEKAGQVTLFTHTYGVGRHYSRQTVEIQFDPRTHEWLIRDEQGQLLRRHPSKEFTYEQICHLQLAKRHKRNKPGVVS